MTAPAEPAAAPARTLVRVQGPAPALPAVVPPPTPLEKLVALLWNLLAGFRKLFPR